MTRKPAEGKRKQRGTAKPHEANTEVGQVRPAAATDAKSGGDLGFERTLWQAADKLRNNMDAGEYKHVVLGLIILKYISGAFEERHIQLLAQQGDGADPEDPDEYRAERVFGVPKAARWPGIQARPGQEFEHAGHQRPAASELLAAVWSGA